MDGSDPELTRIDPELFDPFVDLVRSPVGIGNRDDALLVRFQLRQKACDLEGEGSGFAASRTRNEKDAARLLDCRHLSVVEIRLVQDEHLKSSRV